MEPRAGVPRASGRPRESASSTAPSDSAPSAKWPPPGTQTRGTPDHALETRGSPSGPPRTLGRVLRSSRPDAGECIQQALSPTVCGPRAGRRESAEAKGRAPRKGPKRLRPSHIRIRGLPTRPQERKPGPRRALPPPPTSKEKGRLHSRCVLRACAAAAELQNTPRLHSGLPRGPRPQPAPTAPPGSAHCSQPHAGVWRHLLGVREHCPKSCVQPPQLRSR